MTFENEFSEKQKDMLALALEFARKVGGDISNIYIYASFENMYAFDIFYQTHGDKVAMLHQISDNKIKESDLDDLIFSVLKMGNQDLQDIHSICQKYHQPMPTQIKLIYDKTNDSVKGQYSYEKFYSNSDTLTADDIFEQWYNEVKKEVEQSDY